MASNQLSPRSSPEEVFRTHYAELSRLVSDSTNRLALAPELFGAQLITKECFNSATDNCPKSDMEKGLLLMRGLMSTINSQPQLLSKIIDFLRKVEAFKSVAEKMQHDLSYTPNEVVVTSVNKAVVTNVPKLRHLVIDVLTKRHAQLCDSSRTCLPALASKMFAAGLISSEVQRSPSFNGIIDEFKSGMSFVTEKSELENHCIKFLRACIEIRGAIAMAARALQKDWKEVGMELNID